MQGLERQETVDWQFKLANKSIALPVPILYLDPEVSGAINNIFRIVEKQLLVEIGELSILH
jgi:hypothetical protein